MTGALRRDKKMIGWKEKWQRAAVRREHMHYLGLLAGLFGLDFLLKERVEAQKPEEFPRDLEGTGGKIRLYRNHNQGFCFGFLKEKAELVRQIPIVITSAAAGILAWLLTHKKSTLPERLGFTLITAGGLSNLCDRLRKGYVVDYFSFQVKWLEKVVFNLGDLFLFAGTLFLAVGELLEGKNPKEGIRWPWQKRHEEAE